MCTFLCAYMCVCVCICHTIWSSYKKECKGGGLMFFALESWQWVATFMINVIWWKSCYVTWELILRHLKDPASIWLRIPALEILLPCCKEAPITWRGHVWVCSRQQTQWGPQLTASINLQTCEQMNFQVIPDIWYLQPSNLPAEAPGIMKQRQTIPSMSELNSWITETMRDNKWLSLF